MRKLEQMKKFWSLYIFIGVFGFLSLIFGLYPVVKSVLLSLNDSSTVFTDPEFVGLLNYKETLADPYFWDSFKVTALFTIVSVVLNLVVALALAQMLSRKSLGRSALVFKLAIFVPFIVPDVVGALVWKQFFNTDGALNQILVLMGFQPIGWLNESATAIAVLVFVELWKHVGLYTVIFLTNYQLIDNTMYEAAGIDGASAWQQYRYITLPTLKPAFVLNAVYAVIQFMKTYSVSRLITFGGPNYATNFVSYYAYKKYEQMDFGSATSIATILFVVVITFTLIGMKIRGDENER